MSQGGQVGRPLPGDARLFGGQTTSLCAPGAWRDFRIAFQTISAGTSPAVVLLSTDGYPNAFREDAGFLQVGVDLLDLIRQEGLDPVAAGLESWLAEATEQGRRRRRHPGPALPRRGAARPAAPARGGAAAASPPAAAGVTVGAR